MRLEDIGNEKVKIGEITDTLTEKVFSITVKKCNHTYKKKFSQYKMDIIDPNFTETDNPSLGYIQFVPDLHFDGDYSIAGLKVEDIHRGKGISDALFETLFQYAESQKSEVTSVIEERKPLTAFVLQKYGFRPVGEKTRDTVHILGRYANEQLMIAFEDDTKAREFQNSNICGASDQYEVVSKPEKRKILDTVILRTPYVLTESKITAKRRKQTQERFKIDIYNS